MNSIELQLSVQATSILQPAATRMAKAGGNFDDVKGLLSDISPLLEAWLLQERHRMLALAYADTGAVPN